MASPPPPDPRLTAFSFRRQRLDGSAPSVGEALSAVVGVYSAMPGGPLSLRVRARGLGVSPDDVRDLERRREAVRMRAMRTSAFLVPVATAPLVASATAVPESRFAWMARAAGVPDDELPAVRRAIVTAAAEPATVPELRARLAAEGFEGDVAPWVRGEALGRVVSLLTATGVLVATATGSLSSNTMRYVARESWFAGAGGDAGPGADAGAAPPPDQREARAWLAGEYLSAFGPARAADLAWWAGWTAPVAAEALAAHDTVDIGGGLLLHARDLDVFERSAPLPDDEPVLLPNWDAWTMGYPLDGRSRFLDLAVHDRVFDGDGNGLAMVLRAGRAIGAWAHRGAGSRMQVDLDLFERVSRRERASIEAELASIAAFLGYRGIELRDAPTVIPQRRRIRRPLDAPGG